MIVIVFSALLFAAVSAAAYAVSTMAAAEKSPMAVRLRQLRSAHTSTIGASYGPRPNPFVDLVARLGGFLPAREGRDALRTGLIRAGYRRPETVMVFLGSKLALAVALPLLWIAVGYLSARPLGNIALWTVIAAAVGFYLPTAFVWWRQHERHDSIVASLPDALDLMVVCVEAGLGMAAALQRVATEIRIASRELSEELSLVHQEMQTGVSRIDALRNLAQRTGVEDIYSLVAMLIQTYRLGTSVAQALRAHADSMRTGRRQRAEQMARKASVKLAFPLVFLVFPAMLVVILGPAALQLLKALTSGD